LPPDSQLILAQDSGGSMGTIGTDVRQTQPIADPQENFRRNLNINSFKKVSGRGNKENRSL
jgi:hypothetical protein